MGPRMTFWRSRSDRRLGLVWGDIDLEQGFVRVRKQLDRDGTRVEPKTPQSKRDIVLMPALARILREHRLGSPFSLASDFVFASARGTGLYFRNVERRGLDAAAAAAGLNDGDRPKLRMHDLRHSFASMLISSGADVVTVSRQLGHASPQASALDGLRRHALGPQWTMLSTSPGPNADGSLTPHPA